MQLYGFVILSILVVVIEGNFRENNNDLQRKMEAARRILNNNDKLIEQSQRKNRVLVQPSGSSTGVTGSAQSKASLVQEPVRIAVFNDGDYDAHVKLNYILNERQDEQELEVPIYKGFERDLILPRAASHIRIRVIVIGIVSDQLLIDRQLTNFDGINEVCYLLAGDRARPVYGLCAGPYAEYYKLWTGRN
ncbi:unnamed protein product [Adineta steineri]|uniref:Uncharacterized protein n=1 Tax=Adineta steineri TaxID=433720 RepID=A0A814PTF3_9BILA|nr:unnamed protein product [Adineta steineri]CAF4043538.1 unnamed protein product [Adineta steineri]